MSHLTQGLSRGDGVPVSSRTGRWPPRPRTVVKIVAAVLVLLFVAGVGVYFYLDSKLTRVSALADSPASAGQNWLITGSTGTLTGQQVVQLHTGHNADTLSDTIMVLHMPANGGAPVLVSIPRDSYVPIPGNGQNKINAAYAFGGARLLIQTVQNVTGLHIDHYLGIGYTGLVSVVDAIGGVTMCLPGPMADPNAGLNLKAGCQTLNGAEALGYVRTRAFALGDLQRVQDQRVLLRAILSKLTSAGTLVNPFASIPAAVGAANAITVDQGTHLNQLFQVAFALRNPQTTTVPFGGFESTSVGSVVLWDRPAALQLFDDLAKDRPVPKSLLTGSSAKPTV
jgi:LCP family protein required for cell wall assembly